MSWLNVVAKTNLRTSAVLTGSYVASDSYDTTGVSEITLLVDFTIGSLTSMQMTVEVSHDNSTWFEQSIDNAQTPTAIANLAYERSFTATAKRAVVVPVKTAYVRAKVKGTGTLTGSLCAIHLMVGRV